MGEKFAGSWKLDRSENLENYLDAIDVGTIRKAAMMKLTPTMIVKVDGEHFDVTMKAGIKTFHNTFKLGEDYVVKTDEMEAKGNTVFSDGKLLTELTPTKDAKKVKQKLIREIVDGELVQTMIVGDLTAKRIFKKM